MNAVAFSTRLKRLAAVVAQSDRVKRRLDHVCGAQMSPVRCRERVVRDHARPVPVQTLDGGGTQADVGATELGPLALAARPRLRIRDGLESGLDLELPLAGDHIEHVPERVIPAPLLGARRIDLRQAAPDA